MKRIEDMINEEVEYWVEQWEQDDNNLFKIEVDEDLNVENLDEKMLSEYISTMWKSKTNYLYIELNHTMLLEQYLDKVKQWKKEREEWDYDYWYDRGL